MYNAVLNDIEGIFECLYVLKLANLFKHMEELGKVAAV